MEKRTLFWKDGRREVIEGDNVKDAFDRAGYQLTDLNDIAFHAAGERTDFVFCKSKNKWLDTQEQKHLLLSLYSFDEICDVLGVYEGMGQSAFDGFVQGRLNELIKEKYDFEAGEFGEIIMGHAIINGNFSEVLQEGYKLPI